MPSSCKLLFFLLSFCFVIENFSDGSSTLPRDELEALHDIAVVLNKTNWNFNVDPCGGGWTDKDLQNNNNVTCDCKIPNVDGCHVVMIVLKQQNLSGTLPANLSGLPYLRTIDLTKNYLYGNIPSHWGSTKLVKISLLGNRLTGSIPKEIGNISTLQDLVLEYNQLSGVLPPQLGNLRSLQTLLLTSNYFTGELPETLGTLTTLTDLRIGDNPFVGRIPSFLQNLTNLEKLVIQGNNISGPIPSGLGLLAKMHDLRISDLVNGVESQFPDLSNMTNLNVLILRNCNLIGPLPNYWDKLTNLRLEIDLSFNKLTGEFPSTFIEETDIHYMYLTHNMFSGIIPSYTYEKANFLDLSYNNFSATTSCQSQRINLFASSSMNNVSKTVACLQSYKCPKKKFHSMNINCGGPATRIGKVSYDEDLDVGGPSNFYQSKSNWVYSNTGNFIDTNNPMDGYIQTNTTPLSPNATLYLTARISPLSLTYYAICMMDGNYTVQLHFAEIKFTGDKSYKSLGRRFFNIYVQGNLVLENFNIEDAAGGIGIPVTRSFFAIVRSNTLEIRFSWAGKGTNGIPDKGVWGPLISAITVSPNFHVPSDGKISTPLLIGIVIASIVAFSLFLSFLWLAWTKQKDTMEADLRSLKLQTGWFTLRQVKAATQNFDPANKLGEGGFGSVYKGILSDGTKIAVKQLSSVSKQGNREFINEIGMISALRHPNLVKLLGCCIDGDQLMLAYEYMENNSLARALYGPPESRIAFDWPTRLSICIGIARGLAYLHEESMVKIVHRDIKATNVLLDENLNPKISDFGLAKLTEDGAASHVSTKIAGTFGYMAPEYAMRGHLTSKADVYSFGVVVLEIVSGKSTAAFRPPEQDCYYLLDWALLLRQRGKLVDLIDKRMGLEYDQDEVMSVIHVALLCTNVSPAVRPLMSAVVSMLEGAVTTQAKAPAFPAALGVDVSDAATHPSTTNEDVRSSFSAAGSWETTTLLISERSDSQV